MINKQLLWLIAAAVSIASACTQTNMEADLAAMNHKDYYGKWMCEMTFNEASFDDPSYNGRTDYTSICTLHEPTCGMWSEYIAHLTNGRKDISNGDEGGGEIVRWILATNDDPQTKWEFPYGYVLYIRQSDFLGDYNLIYTAYINKKRNQMVVFRDDYQALELRNTPVFYTKFSDSNY